MTKHRSGGRHRAGSDSKHDRAGLKGKQMLTKKGGAGGNYTWGRPGDEYFIPEIRKGDPVYDSDREEDNGYLAVSLHAEPFKDHDFSYLNYAGQKLMPPKLTLKDFKEESVKIIREFYLEGNMSEFIHRIEVLDSSLLHYELVKKLISTAMEKTDRERELCSKILIELQDAKMLPVSQLAKAFERLFEAVDDIQLDVPNAKRYLAHFLSRSVVDEVLPPAFLTDKYVESLGGPIVFQAKVQLSMKHNYGRIERIWGPNKNSTLDELKQEIKIILLEYLSSADCTEVAALVKNLNVPFFHHEIIKRGVIVALEHKEREQAMISILFKELVKNAVISTQQCIYGFQRLYQEINDIKLDNPDAETVLEIFASQAVKDGCLAAPDLEDLKLKARQNEEKYRKGLEEDLVSGYEGRTRAYSNE